MKTRLPVDASGNLGFEAVPIAQAGGASVLSGRAWAVRQKRDRRGAGSVGKR